MAKVFDVWCLEMNSFLGKIRSHSVQLEVAIWGPISRLNPNKTLWSVILGIILCKKALKRLIFLILPFYHFHWKPNCDQGLDVAFSPVISGIE